MEDEVEPSTELFYGTGVQWTGLINHFRQDSWWRNPDSEVLVGAIDYETG